MLSVLGSTPKIVSIRNRMASTFMWCLKSRCRDSSSGGSVALKYGEVAREVGGTPVDVYSSQ